MIQLLIYISVALLMIIGFFLIRKATALLPLMHNGEPDENEQFLRQFGLFYLILAGIGIVVGIFDLPFFSLFYIFGLLVISAVFSFLLAQKIL